MVEITHKKKITFPRRPPKRIKVGEHIYTYDVTPQTLKDAKDYVKYLHSSGIRARVVPDVTWEPKAYHVFVRGKRGLHES